VANSAEWAGLDAETLIRKADEALYKAKSESRNRIVISRPQGFGQVRATGESIIA